MSKYLDHLVGMIAKEVSERTTVTDEGDSTSRQAAFRLRSNYKRCRDNLLKVINRMYGYKGAR